MDLQDSKKAKKTIMDHVYDAELTRRENIENFKSKEVVEKIRNENFDNSVKVNYLGRSKIWKPDKAFVMNGRKTKMFDGVHMV